MTAATDHADMTRAADSIVITGAGMVCALGLNKHDAWQAVRLGRCGIGPLTALEQPDASRQGGQVPEMDGAEEAATPREVQFLQRALDEALGEAKLNDTNWPQSRRIGFVLGTTLGGMRSGGAFLRSDSPEHLRSFLAASTLQQAVHGRGIGGMAATTCAACASGLSAIALGVTLLRRGELDVVIAGGYDPVSEYVYAGFNSLRLITEGPPLPFSSHRQGMKLGEGSALVVLERARDAEARSAQPLARVMGFGESSDAHHLTQPQPDGLGAAAAMVAALADAGLEPDDISMVAAHATATPNNDAAEFAAYQRVFGDRLPQLPVTAFKSHLGHTLGAAGAVELVLSMMAMRDGVVPPVANVAAGDIEFQGLNVVTGEAQPAEIHHTMNLSLGFGGANGCIVLGRADEHAHKAATAVRTVDREVCITGIGVLVPGCVGNDAFVARLNDDAYDLERGPRDIDEDELLPLFANARRVRRFSTFVKLMLAGANLALRDAGLDGPDAAETIEQCCAFLGSTQGAVAFTDDYYRQVVQEGIDAANPMLFAEGVPNVASAQLSLMLNLRGTSQTFIGSRTSGLEALHVARMRIASGACNRAIVGAAEEHHALVQRAYQSCGLHRAETGGSGFITGAGAVVLMLEARDEAVSRTARIFGTVDRTCAMRSDGEDRQAMAAACADALHAIGRSSAVITSANNTWLDRLEHAGGAGGAGDSGGVGDDGGVMMSSLYGRVPEMFAVTPLAGVAAALLTGSLPRPKKSAGGGQPVDGLSTLGVLGCDYNGSVAAARLGGLARR